MVNPIEVTVEEVEARLGLTLDLSKAQPLTSFLEDRAAFISSLYAERGKTPTPEQAAQAHRMVVNDGVNFYLSADRPRGVVSQTEVVDDVSKSTTWAQGGPDPTDPYRPLSYGEKVVLGLGGSRIKSFKLVNADRSWRS